MESLVNCDYLEEEFPSPKLRAGSAGQRAEDRLLVQVAYEHHVTGILNCTVVYVQEVCGLVGPYYRLVYTAAGPGERAAAWQDLLARLNKLEVNIPNIKGCSYSQFNSIK